MNSALSKRALGSKQLLFSVAVPVGLPLILAHQQLYHSFRIILVAFKAQRILLLAVGELDHGLNCKPEFQVLDGQFLDSVSWHY